MVSATFTTGIILPVCSLLVALLPCEIHSVFTDAIFEEIPLQGTFLELYETGYKAYSSAECAMVCSVRRASSPGCQAFWFDTQGNTCQFYFYQPSSSAVASSSLQVFRLKILDVFHNAIVGDRQLTIYGSSLKLTRPGSRDLCHELGGYLLEFESLEDYEVIERTLAGSPEDSFHVGYNDEAIEGTWVSERDGSPGDTSLLVWYLGGPDNYGNYEHCAILVTTLRLVGDVTCSANLPALCKRDV